MEALIDEIAKTFFDSFVSSDLESVDVVGKLTDLFVPGALVIQAGFINPNIYLFSDFLKSRQRTLTEGRLMNFREHEVTSRTDLFSNIAHRFCVYQKSGMLDGNPFKKNGMKTIQLVCLDRIWKISSVAWDDEREGLSIPECYFAKPALTLPRPKSSGCGGDA